MSVDYQEKYKFLKRKLKILVCEHESLTQELEKSQRKLLKVARDNSFLLDQLLQYEQVVFDSPVDSDATLSSDSDNNEPPQKKRNTVTVPAKVKEEPVEKKEITADKSTKTSAAEYNEDPLEVVTTEVANPSTCPTLDSEDPEIDMQMPSDIVVSGD